MERYYSVVVGRQPGLHLDWVSCNTSVQDYLGAVFRKWPTLHDATKHLNSHGIPHADILVHSGSQQGSQTSTLAEYCHEHAIPLPAESPYEQQTLFNLLAGLFAEICTLRGEACIDIHQRDWETQARKGKGLVLTRGQWFILKTIAPRLEDALEKVRGGAAFKTSEHLGDDIYATVAAPYKVINIRRWYEDDSGALKPSFDGITIRWCEWLHLLNIAPLIDLSLWFERKHKHGCL